MRSAAQEGHGRRKAATAFAATILVVVAMSGCGGARSPLAVRLALTAPADGSSVAVSNLKVLGTVDPPSAAVVVAGKHVHVAHGAFARWMSLRKGLSHITIIATAAGYAPAKLNIAVRNSPRSLPTRARIQAGAISTIPRPARHRYDSRVQAALLRTCKASAAGTAAATALCECYLAHLEARVSEDVLLASERAFLKGEAKLPRWLREAALSCRDSSGP
jgi:Glucodextranase, domain B